MSIDSLNWLAQLTATDTPVLPDAVWGRVWLSLGWSVVLAWPVAVAAQRWFWGWRTPLIGALVLWCGVPGPYSPSYWLGLAFQAPSISTVLLCALLVRARWFPVEQGGATPDKRRPCQSCLALAGLGVVLGWLLLLDTLARLPVAWYAWGFSPAAMALVVLAALTPWVLGGGTQSGGVWRWVAPLSVLLFVALRLPTGNVWDALLDPWLWAGLHVYVLRSVGSLRSGRAATSRGL